MTDETVAALLAASLDAARAAAVRAHLDECAPCRRLVADAARAATTLARPPRETDELRPGQVVAGRYTIERVLGEGGMGRVYVAFQRGLARRVALKVLRDRAHPEIVERFAREARALGALRGEHVVAVHDLGTLDDGSPYIAMELLDGEDLAALLARRQPTIDEAVRWIREACDALAEAHAIGLVHRDVKPSNLFLERDARIKVLDFGLVSFATSDDPGITGTALLGTPMYMAPEQVLRGRVDARTDVWGIGATLYRMLAGHPPHEATDETSLFEAIIHAEPAPLPPHVPAGLRAIVERSLAKDPSERFADAGELRHALVALDRPHRRRFVPLAVGVAAVGGFLIFAVPRLGAGPEPAPIAIEARAGSAIDAAVLATETRPLEPVAIPSPDAGVPRAPFASPTPDAGVPRAPAFATLVIPPGPGTRTDGKHVQRGPLQHALEPLRGRIGACMMSTRGVDVHGRVRRVRAILTSDDRGRVSGFDALAFERPADGDEGRLACLRRVLTGVTVSDPDFAATDQRAAWLFFAYVR